MTVGTPSYMAPEQAIAGEIGPWTDLYSVGILTYELILGDPPFADSDTPVSILMRHVNEPIRSAVELQPSLDPGLSQWVDSLLVKDPRQRVRHALDAWESLEDIVVRLLGPLWRRDARLLADRADAVEADPLTPAPFESHVSISTPAPRPAGLPGAFITFEPDSPQRVADAAVEPEPEPDPEPEPEPEPEPPEPKTERDPAPSAPEPPTPDPAGAELALEQPGPAREQPEPEPAREQPEPVPHPPEPAQRRTSILVAALVAALAATVGFVDAPTSRSAPRGALALAQSASTDGFSISYPREWRSVAMTNPAAASLKLSRPVTLVPSTAEGGAFIAGTTLATDATLLPKGFGATLLSAPEGAAVKLGAWTFRRYLNLLPAGAGTPETVYALPSTGGTVIASCVAPTANATMFAATCERIVATLRLASATALPPTPNPAFGRALSAVVRTLDAARTIDGQRLTSANHPSEQAAAARRLAVAHGAAATAASRLAPGPIGADADAAIVASLRNLSAAYTSPARAADRADKQGYAAASTAITQADAALAAGFARLREDGFTVG